MKEQCCGFFTTVFPPVTPLGGGPKDYEIGLEYHNTPVQSREESSLHEISGYIGDVILLHPLMLHSASRGEATIKREGAVLSADSAVTAYCRSIDDFLSWVGFSQNGFYDRLLDNVLSLGRNLSLASPALDSLHISCFTHTTNGPRLSAPGASTTAAAGLQYARSRAFRPQEATRTAFMSLKPPSFRPQPSQPNVDEEYDFELTIRFSASLPDLLLSIPASLNANTATLKQLIRSRIPDEHAKHRIRLIYAGKALVDDVSLGTSLKKNLSRPPSRVGTPGPYDGRGRGNGAINGKGAQDDAQAKGKQVQRDAPAQSRIYIHCSIGDIVLTAKELADEAATAASAQASGDGNQDGAPTAQEQTTTTPAPRGFDRLLNAGFSAAEVQSLRLQFLALQAHTHTPDTMPSPSTLRDMEDRWLDNSNATGDADTDALAGGLGADDDLQTGALDDMIWGTAMGFFWPIGCLMWGVREEGIWSQRRKMAVVVGFLLNIGLGLIRYGG